MSDVLEMTNLNYQQALDLLNRAVEEKGADYVYPEEEKRNWKNIPGGAVCSYYVSNGEARPSCIIGHVIEYLGLRDQFLPIQGQYEGKSGVSALNALGVRITRRADVLLDTVQSEQDSGHPWGEAVEQAVYQVAMNDVDDEVYR